MHVGVPFFSGALQNGVGFLFVSVLKKGSNSQKDEPTILICRGATSGSIPWLWLKFRERIAAIVHNHYSFMDNMVH